MNAKILIVITSVLLSGCISTYSDPVVIKTVAVKKPKLDLLSPEPLTLTPLNWVIITPENKEEVFEKLEKDNISLALFSLTDEGYKGLALNYAEIRAYIIKQNTIIEEYRNYYEKEEDPVQSSEK